MASNVPVIATPVDGTKEAVVDKETGILVPTKDPEAIADAILFLLKNPDIMKKMGDEGRKRVADYFSLEQQIRLFEDLYLSYV